MEVRGHFSPLYCTFLHCISKNQRCKPAGHNFFNEIKDLEQTLKESQEKNRSE